MNTFNEFQLLIMGLTLLPILIHLSSFVQSLFEKVAKYERIPVWILGFGLGFILQGYEHENALFQLISLGGGFFIFIMFYGACIATLLKERRNHSGK